MYINLLRGSTPSDHETERRHNPPCTSSQRHPRRHRVRVYGRGCTNSGIWVGQEALDAKSNQQWVFTDRGVINGYEFQHIVPVMPC